MPPESEDGFQGVRLGRGRRRDGEGGGRLADFASAQQCKELFIVSSSLDQKRIGLSVTPFQTSSGKTKFRGKS